MAKTKKTVKPFYKSRVWQQLREEILKRDNYLCQRCLQQGKVTPADAVHHIKSIETHPELALDPNNLIGSCHSCHNKEHPEKQFFSKLRKRIIAVLGYPASGKTTYVRKVMTPQDIVLDLDRLVAAMTYRDGHDRTNNALYAVKIADDMISQAVKDIRTKDYSFDTLYVIRSRLSDEELGSLRAARAKLCWLDVDKDTCLERLRRQGREDIADVAFKKCDEFLAKHGSKLRKIR